MATKMSRVGASLRFNSSELLSTLTTIRSKTAG